MASSVERPPSAVDLRARHQAASRVVTDVFQRAMEFDLPDQVRAMGIMPYFRELTRNEGPTCIIEGREAVMLGSNNYLGLTTDARVRRAAIEAIEEEGPSLTGSRLLNGTTTRHTELEARLARFLGREDALVFTTGYQANVGALSALCTPETTLLLDKLCHASIHDGAALTQARTITFRHNDLKDLDRLLSAARAEGRALLVMVDGVYSMEGDLCDYPRVRELCDAYGARIIVDDAHALGVMGATGRGTEEQFGMRDTADVLTGTFSKSLASIGGWVAGPRKVIDWMRFYARPIVFSASLPPPSLAAAAMALEILEAEPWRVARVNENGRYWRDGLRSLGFDVGQTASPIVPVRIGDDLKCLLFGRALLDEGVYINPVLYPAVPREHAAVRSSVMATHERAHLDRALEVFERVGRRLEIIR